MYDRSNIKNRKLNIEKLLSFGFEKTDGGYVYHTDLVDGQMKLTVKIDAEGKLCTEVVDNNSDDEYVLHCVAGAAGSFVGQVKTEYEEILEKISAKCFDPEVFKSKQAKEVIAYVKDTYGDELEYLWQKFLIMQLCAGKTIKNGMSLFLLYPAAS